MSKKLKKIFTFQNFAIVFIIALAIFTRLFKLTEVPVGLHDDEAAMAYDAFSLAHWRVNRQMMHLPVYLPNYGGGQSALYAYVDAFFILIFGLNTFIIRLPAALFSLAVVLFGGLIMKDIYGKKTGILAGLLLAIFPYFICQGRFGLDCNLFLGTAVISFFLLLLAIKKQKILWWLLAGLSFGITLYSYALSWIVVPILLLLTFIYLLWLKKITFTQLLSFFGPFLILALPLFLFVLINTFDFDPIFTRFFYIPKLNSFRSDEFNINDISPRLLDLPRSLLYISNQDNFESFMTGWTLYAWSLPFLIFGLIGVVKKSFFAIKNKKFTPESLVVFWMISELILTVIQGSVLHRHNSAFFPLAFCVIYGIRWFYQSLKPQWRNLYVSLVLTIYLISFGYFYYQYFIVFPNQGYQMHFDDTPQRALEALDSWSLEQGISSEQLNQRQIWIDVKYIFYYLGAQVPPTLSSPTHDVLNEVRFNNLHFEFLPKQEPIFDFIPEEINPQDIYIISNTGNQTGYINELDELGLEEIYSDQKWTVWLDPSSFNSESESTVLPETL